MNMFHVKNTKHAFSAFCTDLVILLIKGIFRNFVIKGVTFAANLGPFVGVTDCLAYIAVNVLTWT